MSLLAAAMLVALQSADSTLVRLESAGLSVLPGEVPTHYSEAAKERAEALQDATRRTIRLIQDSLEAVPPEIRLAVLNEEDWPKVAPWQLPYGIHTVAGPPHVFVAPSRTDRGQYFDSLSADPELRVDLIGLHYLAHHLALAIYPPAAAADPPVKWLDEIITSIVEDYLLGAFDPRLTELETHEAEQVGDLRVTTLAGFDEEYNGYFSTREGAPNYGWFIERLGEAGRGIMERHGWKLLRDLRPDLRPDLESEDAYRLLSTLGVDLASAGFHAAGASAQSFDWFFDLQTGFRTSGVAIADFDQDGYSDLAFAVGEHWPLPTLVFLNDGFGNFDLDQEHRGRDQKGQAVVADDLNGDGAPDLLLVTEIGDRNVVFLNDGTGRLYPAWRLGDVGDNGRDAVLVDLDQDGRTDIVTANRGQPNRVFRNHGPDGFEPWFDFGSARGATVAVVAADFTGDGYPDIATADWSGESAGVQVWVNEGGERLRAGYADLAANRSISDIATGDLDGDGWPDLAVGVLQRNPLVPDAEGFQYDSWIPGGQDFVLLNDGRGAFDERWEVGLESDRTTSLLVADMDSDGLADIVAGYARGDSYYSYTDPQSEYWFDRLTPGYFGAVLVNRGDGQFHVRAEFNTHLGNPHDIAADDLNGDGFADIAVAGGRGTSAVFLNSLGPEVGTWRR